MDDTDSNPSRNTSPEDYASSRHPFNQSNRVSYAEYCARKVKGIKTEKLEGKSNKNKRCRSRSRSKERRHERQSERSQSREPKQKYNRTENSYYTNVHIKKEPQGKIYSSPKLHQNNDRHRNVSISPCRSRKLRDKSSSPQHRKVKKERGGSGENSNSSRKSQKKHVRSRHSSSEKSDLGELSLLKDYLVRKKERKKKKKRRNRSESDSESSADSTEKRKIKVSKKKVKKIRSKSRDYNDIHSKKENGILSKTKTEIGVEILSSSTEAVGIKEGIILDMESVKIESSLKENGELRSGSEKIEKCYSKTDSLDAINRILKKQILEKQIVDILSDDEVQEIISVPKPDATKRKSRKKTQDIVIDIETSEEEVLPIESLTEEIEELDPPTKMLKLMGLSRLITEEGIRSRINKNSIIVPRPDIVEIVNEGTFCCAILHFRTAQFAFDFKTKFNGKYDSCIQNIFFVPEPTRESPDETYSDQVDAECATTSTISQKPPALIDQEQNSLQTLQKPLSFQPVFIEVKLNNDKKMSKLKVYLQNRNKCQQFVNLESSRMVASFFNYIKKYFPSESTERLILVTPCIASYEIFLKCVFQNISDKLTLQTLFAGWLDLTTLVSNEANDRLETLKYVKFDPYRIQTLHQHQQYPNPEQKVESTVLMKLILVKVLKSNPKLKIDSFIQPFLIKEERYLILVLHIGILELDLKSQGHILPAVGTIGYLNNIRGSWFVPIEPQGREANVVLNSAERLGFKKSNILKEGKLLPVWSHGDGTSAHNNCLTERDALESFLATVQSEKAQSQFARVAVLTPRNDHSFGVFLSALMKHNLLAEFLNIVNVVGSIEELGVLKNISFKASGLHGYSRHYFKCFGKDVNLSNPKNVPKIIYTILESLLKSAPTYENFLSIYAHPSISGFTNLALYLSHNLELREDYYALTIAEQTYLKAGSQELVSVKVTSALNTDIGEPFYAFGFGETKIAPKKQTLSPDFGLEITILNASKDIICLKENEKVGIASKIDYFPFSKMSAICTKLTGQTESGHFNPVSQTVEQEPILSKKFKHFIQYPCKPSKLFSNIGPSVDRGKHIIPDDIQLDDTEPITEWPNEPNGQVQEENIRTLNIIQKNDVIKTSIISSNSKSGCAPKTNEASKSNFLDEELPNEDQNKVYNTISNSSKVITGPSGSNSTQCIPELNKNEKCKMQVNNLQKHLNSEDREVEMNISESFQFNHCQETETIVEEICKENCSKNDSNLGDEKLFADNVHCLSENLAELTKQPAEKVNPDNKSKDITNTNNKCENNKTTNQERLSQNHSTTYLEWKGKRQREKSASLERQSSKEAQFDPNSTEYQTLESSDSVQNIVKEGLKPKDDNIHNKSGNPESSIINYFDTTKHAKTLERSSLDVTYSGENINTVHDDTNEVPLREIADRVSDSQEHSQLNSLDLTEYVKSPNRLEGLISNDEEVLVNKNGESLREVDQSVENKSDTREFSLLNSFDLTEYIESDNEEPNEVIEDSHAMGTIKLELVLTDSDEDSDIEHESDRTSPLPRSDTKELQICEEAGDDQYKPDQLNSSQETSPALLESSQPQTKEVSVLFSKGESRHNLLDWGKAIPPSQSIQNELHNKQPSNNKSNQTKDTTSLLANKEACPNLLDANDPLKLSADDNIPLDEKQPNNTFLDSNQQIKPIQDTHVSTKQPKASPDTCVPFPDKQPRHNVNKSKQTPEICISSDSGTTEISVLLNDEPSSSNTAYSSQEKCATPDVPIHPPIDLDYCLIILEKLINPLTPEKHIKPLLEDLMDCVKDPERKKLAMRIADPDLDQREKRKLITEFKTFDSVVNVVRGQYSCEQYPLQSTPCQIIPKIEPDLLISSGNLSGQKKSKTCSIQLKTTIGTLKKRKRKEKKKYKVELKLKYKKKTHLVKIRRCCVKVDRLLPSTIQSYSKRKPIKKRKEIWIETKPNCNFSRRSERVFIKDSLINYAPKAEEIEGNCNLGKSNKNDHSKKFKFKLKNNTKNCLVKRDSKCENSEVEEFSLKTKEDEVVKTLIDPEKPLVQQLRKIDRKLPKCLKNNETDLSLDFPSLLTAPELESVIWTFLRFHQVQVEALDQKLQQFADLLITELVTADITNLKLLEEMIIKIHQKHPAAAMDEWIEAVAGINENFQSIILADQMENYFDLDVAIQVLILHNMPAICELEKYITLKSKPWMIKP